MAVHNVQQGDHLSGIAEKYGFRQTSIIWDHPNNADLKSQRQDPEILFPGDQVFIPDKAPKTESRSTAAVHKFTVPREKLKLKLALLDVNGNPRANESCTLTVDGDSATLTTGGDGTLEKLIPRTASQGKLVLSDLEMQLMIGHLDPLDQQSGQIARLNNLGYEAGDPKSPDKDRVRSAVEEFQCDQSLPVTGDCDDSTQAQLKTVHGC